MQLEEQKMDDEELTLDCDEKSLLAEKIEEYGIEYGLQLCDGIRLPSVRHSAEIAKRIIVETVVRKRSAETAEFGKFLRADLLFIWLLLL